MKRRTPGSVPDDRPAALVTSGARGIRISAANRAALSAGIEIGSSLADARAAMPDLLTRPAEPEMDAAALHALAEWLGRYGPARNVDGPDGAWIDVTGVPHLFGDEHALCTDLRDRLRRLGFTARIGLAETHGAAHALARFPGSLQAGEGISIAVPGAAKAALSQRPVAALRLAPDITRFLVRLGLKRIGQLYGLPRASLAARFRHGMKGPARSKAAETAANVLLRLDQALGLIAEPLKSLRPPPEASSRLAFPEPLITAAGLATALERLVADLTTGLAAQGLGARRFRLQLYRADGTVARAEIGTSTPNRDPRHIQRLLSEKVDNLDAGFGIDIAALEACHLEPCDDRQIDLAATARDNGETGMSALVDRLVNRVGPGRVLAFAPGASHIPELAGTWHPAIAGKTPHGTACPDDEVPPSLTPPRPPLLLTPPEPISVIAAVPEGAPQHFVWRRLPRRIVRSEGPERIAPEWRRRLSSAQTAGKRIPLTRDYYRLEDTTGARYWVFREGLYDREDEDTELAAAAGTDTGPRWFMHGLFP